MITHIPGNISVGVVPSFFLDHEKNKSGLVSGQKHCFVAVSAYTCNPFYSVKKLLNAWLLPVQLLFSFPFVCVCVCFMAHLKSIQEIKFRL